MSASIATGKAGSNEPGHVAQPSAPRRLLSMAVMLASNLLFLVFVLLWLFADPNVHGVPFVGSVEWLQGVHGRQVPAATETGTALVLPWKFDAASAGAPRWLRVGFDVAQVDADQDSYAAYFSYLAPGAAVYLNGVFLRTAQGFAASPLPNNWSVPEYFVLPAALIHQGSNHLDLRLDGANGGAIDIGKLLVAPQAVTRPVYKRRLRIQSTGVQIICVLVGLMGAVNALIWWQRRQETMHGLSALSSVFSILYNLEFFLGDPPLPASLYLFICDASMFWLAALLMHLCEVILQHERRQLSRAGYGLAMAATLMMAIFGAGRWMLLPQAMLLVLGVALALKLTVQAWRSQALTDGLLWCAVLITMGAGIYNFLLQWHWLQGTGLNLLPYGWLLFSRAVCWFLIDGFIQNLNEREALNLKLEQRIQAFGKELESQYSRIAALERRNAVTEERARIVRDMHDGLGFHLITALNQVTCRSLTSEELVAVFSAALAELQNTLSATAPEHNDLLFALGDLRARVESGLQDAGIAVSWNIAPPSPQSELMPDDVQEAIRIVQEALSNAIKHSQSATVHLQARSDDDGVTRIRVIDEGIGIHDESTKAGEGMLTMRWRAAKIGARLDILSRPGRTEVVLTLPAVAPAQPGLALAQ